MPSRAETRARSSWITGTDDYFAGPHAVTGPDGEIQVPPGCHDPDLGLEGAAVTGTAGRDREPTEAVAHIDGYAILNKWSARDLRLAAMRLGLGVYKGKDCGNTLGPWIVTADGVEHYRGGDRLDLRLTARIGHRELTVKGIGTLANRVGRGAEPVRLARARPAPVDATVNR